MIKSSFVTVQKSSAGKRILLGFDSGAADLETVVEDYQMTAEGLRKLGTAKSIPGVTRCRAWSSL